MPAPVPRDALLSWFKPSGRGVVGAEFEMLPVDLERRRELPYGGPKGVAAILERLATRGKGWTRVVSEGHLIALDRPDGAAVTLEPGSQLEFSTAPRESVLEVDADFRAFLREVYDVAGDLGFALLAIGLNPFSSTDEVALGPKRRYVIMTEYLRKKGDLALDMMRRTLSVHCSFDFASEADAAEKSRVAFGIAPIVVAMFAHSPLDQLKPNGFHSRRWEIWRRTDPDRCGLLPEVFEPGWDFSRYLDRVLTLPLMFSCSGGVYRAANGLPASRWFAGDWAGLEGHEGLTPVAADLEWVINQSYRDARLRRYLECRASDFPPPSMASAPVALWAGLLYHAPSRAAAWELVRALSTDERVALSAAVAKEGLRAKLGSRRVLDAARDLARLAREGLVARGKGEQALLDAVDAQLARGVTPAEELLARWAGEMKHDPDRLIEALRL